MTRACIPTVCDSKEFGQVSADWRLSNVQQYIIVATSSAWPTTSLLAQASPSTLRLLKLYHDNKSKDAGDYVKGESVFCVRWCSTENPDDVKTSPRYYRNATEIFCAVQEFAMARGVAVTLNTDEHCVMFERM